MQRHQHANSPATRRCPFYLLEEDACRISVAGTKIEWRRSKESCSAEDHDYCTHFVATLLRGSRLPARPEG